MGVEQLFTVATEFRFDIGQAVLGSRMLQDECNAISRAADMAASSFSKIGMSLIGKAGLLRGGFLGSLYEAVEVSDAFEKSQQQIANIIGAQKDKFTGPVDHFIDRMSVAQSVLKDMSDQSKQFGISEQEMFSTFSKVAPVLSAHGQSGTNLNEALNLSRMAIQASQIIGQGTPEHGDVAHQLTAIVEGHGQYHNPLFRSLFEQTKAFEPMRSKHGTGLHNFMKASNEFNAMDTAKRIEIIRKALGQFSSDSDAIAARVNTLSSQLVLLKDNVVGMFGVLKPIGDALKKPLLQIFTELNKVLMTKGQEISQNIANFIGPMLENPRELFVNFMQLKSLGSDLGLAGKVMGIISIVSAIRYALPFFPMLAGAVATTFAHIRNSILLTMAELRAGTSIGKAIRMGGSSLAAESATGGLWPMIKRTFSNMTGLFGGAAAGGAGGSLFSFGRIIGLIGTIARGAAALLARMFLPMLGLVTLFQIISRARAIAKVNLFDQLPELMAKITGAMTNLKNACSIIFEPFNDLVDLIAHKLAPMVDHPFIHTGAKLIELLGDAFHGLATGMIGVYGEIIFAAAFINKVWENVIANFTGGFSVFDAVVENFLSYMTKAFDKVVSILAPLDKMFGDANNAQLAAEQKRIADFTKMLDSTSLFSGAMKAGEDARSTYINGAMNRLNGKDAPVSSHVTNIGKVEIQNSFKDQVQPDRIAFTIKEQLLKAARNPVGAKGSSLVKGTLSSFGSGGGAS